jgi:hypothetical protein
MATLIIPDCNANDCWSENNPDRCEGGRAVYTMVSSEWSSDDMDLNIEETDAPFEYVLCDVDYENSGCYGKQCMLCLRFMYDKWIEKPQNICRLCIDNDDVFNAMDDKTFKQFLKEEAPGVTETIKAVKDQGFSFCDSNIRQTISSELLLDGGFITHTSDHKGTTVAKTIKKIIVEKGKEKEIKLSKKRKRVADNIQQTREKIWKHVAGLSMKELDEIMDRVTPILKKQKKLELELKKINNHKDFVFFLINIDK